MIFSFSQILVILLVVFLFFGDLSLLSKNIKKGISSFKSIVKKINSR